jgi:hypothetical protein
MGAFSLTETNPFEYSFRPNVPSKQPAPMMVSTATAAPAATASVPAQLPPTPVSSAHSSPRQSVHEDSSATEQLFGRRRGSTISPKIRTRSRITTKSQQHTEKPSASKRKLEEEDDDDEDGEERRRKFLERNRQAGKSLISHGTFMR